MSAWSHLRAGAHTLVVLDLPASDGALELRECPHSSASMSAAECWIVRDALGVLRFWR
jgi:hypothetical protein